MHFVDPIGTSHHRPGRHPTLRWIAILLTVVTSLAWHSAVHADCVGGSPNGVVQAGEECDDNDTSNSDYCLTNCIYATCGDAIVCTAGDCHFAPALAGPEECDDGVLNSDVDGNACRSTCDAPSCGDGVRDVALGEQCDDGNDANDDACTSACRSAVCGDGYVRTGVEACDDGNASDSDGCVAGCRAARCGDGYVRASVEACDDGNTNNTDACTDTCQLPECGNGIVQSGEECDDGNSVNELDACPNSCRHHECGDGIRAPDEACDDGNSADDDACTTGCKRATCGDGIVHAGFEECDDGNDSQVDGCKTDCRYNRCGDGYLLVGVEECDMGGLNSDTIADRCRTDCTSPACGDGVTDSHEQCDDGNAVDTDACKTTCRFAVCGDGIVCNDTACSTGLGGGKETCDDGNTSGFDGCSSDCAVEGCGDGVVQAPEQCDAGASNPPDPVEAAGCDADCSFRVCGDRYVNETFGEACDDGNTTSGDGCTSTCAREFCGDGIRQSGLGEQCDDGVANSDVLPDACRTDCSAPSCGDRVVDTDEDCDDGNSEMTDACKNDCRLNVCGDGVVEQGVEGCDDGDGDNADECPNSCATPTCGDGIIQTEFGEECDEGPSSCSGGADDGKVCSTSTQCRGICGAPNPGMPCRPETEIADCGQPGACAMADVSCNDAGNSDQEADACRSNCRLPYCGDGVIDASEECDTSVPGPDRPCAVSDIGGAPSLVLPLNCALAACGDGVVCANALCTSGPGRGPEECDDGNDIETDGCKNDCSMNVCGDGVPYFGIEECDDGPSVCGGGYDAGAPCATDADCRGVCALGTVHVGAPCDSAIDVAHCGQPGICDLSGAACNDEGNSDQAENACRADCNLWYCGDAVTDVSEHCDDGNGVNGDSCTNRCRFPTCGDGILCSHPECTSGFNGGPENCDDGNTTDFDGCSATCQIEGCGDGVVQPGEECDGATLGTNPPAAKETATCDLDCTLATCGDHDRNVARGEECDDGNRTARDGCDATCRDEYCGDGIDNDGAREECDLGAANSDSAVDGCRTNCRSWYCGDSVKDTVERCDHGGETNGCDADCTAVVCGDGIVNRAAGEECDEGAANADAPDACRAGTTAYTTPCSLPRAADGIVDTGRGEVCDAGPNGDASCNPDGCSTGTSPRSFRNGYLGAACQIGVIHDACTGDAMARLASCRRARTLERHLRKIQERLGASEYRLYRGNLPVAERNARYARRRAERLELRLSTLCPEDETVRACLGEVHLPRLIDIVAGLEASIDAIDP